MRCRRRVCDVTCIRLLLGMSIVAPISLNTRLSLLSPITAVLLAVRRGGGVPLVRGHHLLLLVAHILRGEEVPAGEVAAADLMFRG